MTTRLDHARDEIWETLPKLLKLYHVELPNQNGASDESIEACDAYIDACTDALCVFLEAHGIDPHNDIHGNSY